MYKHVLILISILSFYRASGQSIKLQPYFAAAVVANIDSSIAWYKNTLNLTLRNRVDNAERGFKQAILINAETMIELVELKKGIPLDSLLQKHLTGSKAYGYSKFGFTATDIDALYKQLSLKKVQFFGNMVTDPISTKKTFLIQDPDGNLLQFFEP